MFNKKVIYTGIFNDKLEPVILTDSVYAFVK